MMGVFCKIVEKTGVIIFLFLHSGGRIARLEDGERVSRRRVEPLGSSKCLWVYLQAGTTAEMALVLKEMVR